MKKIVLFSILGVFLVSCSSKEKLSGKRVNIILSEEADTVIETDDTSVELDAVVRTDSCCQPFYNAAHISAPQIFAGDFKTLWTADLDFASNPMIRTAAAPVIADGKLFCMDAGGIVYALNTKTGARIWRQSTTIKGKDGQVGGALAYVDGMLIVNTSFSESMAFDGATGKMIWRIKLPAPAKGDAITIYDGKAYVLCGNSSLSVIDVKTGKTLWSHSGIQSDTKFLGNASVAVDSGAAYVVYPSGEIFALQVENGSVLWEAMVSKFSLTNSSETYVHPRACPVVKGEILYVVAANGQTLAFNAKSGAKIWSADCGSVQTPIVSGNSLFVINANSELICLNRLNGKKRWSTLLEKEAKKMSNWYGVALCEKYIITLSPLGQLCFVSVNDGSIKKRIDTVSFSDDVSLNPILVGGIMYIQTNNGKVIAYK